MTKDEMKDVIVKLVDTLDLNTLEPELANRISKLLGQPKIVRNLEVSVSCEEFELDISDGEDFDPEHLEVNMSYCDKPINIGVIRHNIPAVEY